MKSWLLILVIFALTACASPPYYQQNKNGTSIRVEHFYAKRNGGTLIEDPNSPTGYVWRGAKIQEIGKGQKVPLVKGHGFDLHLSVSDAPEHFKEITVLTYRPSSSKLPENIPLKMTHNLKAKRVKSLHEIKYVYFLDEDYDLVEGKWNIEFFFEGERFYQTYFTTVQPSS